MTTDSWELSEELRQIQDTVARFMAAEVKPAEDKLPHDAYELPQDVLLPLQEKDGVIASPEIPRHLRRVERVAADGAREPDAAQPRE